MTTIHAVTIDFWNTLFDSTGGTLRNAIRRAALLGAIREGGQECDDERFDAAYADIWNYFDRHWLERQRTPGSLEMVREMLAQLGVELPDDVCARVADVFARGVLDDPPALLPGVPEALAWLHGRGMRLALISDTAFSPGTVLRELMERVDIARYFSVWIFSDETGVAKPHPEAFRRALEPLGIPPAEACHIGDIERTDIRGARSAGLYAVLYRGDRQRHKYAEEETQADCSMTIGVRSARSSSGSKRR